MQPKLVVALAALLLVASSCSVAGTRPGRRLHQGQGGVRVNVGGGLDVGVGGGGIKVNVGGGGAMGNNTTTAGAEGTLVVLPVPVTVTVGGPAYGGYPGVSATTPAYGSAAGVSVQVRPEERKGPGGP